MDPPRPPPKVLFVHDGAPYDAHIRQLEGAGLHVTETRSDQAVDTASQLQPDIIVLDFGCDGDIGRKFKENPETRHIPVIALIEMLKS